jgi:(aminoalkyl)phosphonate N-acetyltransferase
MIKIRKARVGDFETIYDFMNELKGVSFPREKMNSIFRENLKSQATTYLVAEDNNQVVGFVSCHEQPLLHHCATVAEIQELYVVAHRRKKKVGKRLIDNLKARMKKKSIFQLEVTSNNKRLDAHRFFEREGFRQTSRKFVYKMIA